MFKLAKYLKPFIGSIIVIVILLFIQASTDLMLPDYMSDIVNIGIQQSGIEHSVPNAIRESELEKLGIFINESDFNLVKDNFTKLDKDSLSSSDKDKYIKKYPALDKEPVYELKKINKDTTNKLDDILAKAELTVSGIESGKFDTSKLTDAYKAQMAAMAAKTGQAVPTTTPDAFTILKNMPKDQLNTILDKMNEAVKDLPSSMTKQGSVEFVKSEYKAIGMDVNKLQTNAIIIFGLRMLGIAAIGTAALITVVFLSSRIAAGLSKTLRRDIFNKVTHFSNTEFDKFSTASLVTRSTNDIQQIQMLMSMIFRIVFYAPILGIGAIFKVVKTDASMTWIIGVAVVAILSLILGLFGAAMPKFKILQTLVDKLNLVTRERLTGLLVIRAFGTDKHEEVKFDKANMDLTKVNLFTSRIMSFMMPAMMVVMNLITLLIIWVGSHQVDKGSMQVGDMMAFMQYAMQIIMAFLFISMISILLPRASVSAQRISEVLNTDFSISDKEKVEEFKEDKTGYVEYKDVSFKYPGAEDYALKNLNFTAKPGEVTAIIGSTGSGKSTLINLIPRFYDVTEGQILVNGVDVRNVTQHDLRQDIGFVPQKGLLFSGNIESNLKYGASDISKDDLEKVVDIAQASEFIYSKPDKFESEISQGGTNVSGGQKQRLSIARALAKKATINIFDDSFSALDFKTDAKLRKSLNKNIKDATMIIVAQRISTIKDANQIIVLDEGKVVGLGTHRELLNDCEVYKQIALSQLSKEELDNE